MLFSSEGLSLLYRGLLPPLMMRTSSRAVMFGLYDGFLHRLECPSRSGQPVFSACHSQVSMQSGLPSTSKTNIYRHFLNSTTIILFRLLSWQVRVRRRYVLLKGYKFSCRLQNSTIILRCGPLFVVSLTFGII